MGMYSSLSANFQLFKLFLCVQPQWKMLPKCCSDNFFLDGEFVSHWTVTKGLILQGRFWNPVWSFRAWNRNSTFHIQSRGSVESQNKSIKKALRAKLSEYDGGWFWHLPTVLMAMRATPNRTTGLAPFEICMGRHMALPYDAPLLWAGPPGPLKDTLREYLKLLTCALKSAHFSALKAQNAGDLKKCCV